MTVLASKALIMVVSRTDAIEIAVQELEPEVVGVIVSHDILSPVVMKCEELGPRVKSLYRIVDSPMEISHSFERFEHLLSELEQLGYAPEDVILDVTGGTTPMRSRERFRELTGVDRLPQMLDLVRARTLDDVLGDETHAEDNVLRDLLQKRNSSILAHGLEPISEGSAGRFLEYVDAMVDQPAVRAASEHARLREL